LRPSKNHLRTAVYLPSPFSTANVDFKTRTSHTVSACGPASPGLLTSVSQRLRRSQYERCSPGPLPERWLEQA
jgi:hypothetical protein